MIQRLLRRLGLKKGFDQNEFVRRFLSGDDVDNIEGDYNLTPDAAMKVGAVFACVRVLSETLASLPLQIKRNTPGGGQELADDHPYFSLLYRQPNRQQTSFEWLEMMGAHLALRGNGINEKIYGPGGKLIGLKPINPKRVTLEDYDGTLVYTITREDGNQYRALQDDIVHIRGLASDGYWGLSPVSYASNHINMARSAVKYGVSVFNLGGAKRVVLQHPDQLSDDAKTYLRKSWEAMNRDNAKTTILEEGMTATDVGMSASDAEWVSSRNLERSELAGIFRVPAHMIGDLEKSTFSNIEKQDLFFAKHTIRPFCKRIEQALERDLLGNDPRYSIRFNLDALLRGDVRTRTDSSKVQFMHGAINLDEWRRREGLNPLPDGLGQQHYVPANLIPIEQAGQQLDIDPPELPEDQGQVDQERELLLPFIKDIAARIANYEAREIRKQRGFDRFLKSRLDYVSAVLAPLANAIKQDGFSFGLDLAIAEETAKTLSPDAEINPEERAEYLEHMFLAEIERDPLKKLQLVTEAAACGHGTLAAAGNNS